MQDQKNFVQQISLGYTFKGETILIGCGMLDGEVVPEAKIYLPLKTLNRHGLIAGALQISLEKFWFCPCL